MDLNKLSKIQTELFINLNMVILSMMSDNALLFAENPSLSYTIATGMLGKNIGQLLSTLPKSAQDDMLKFVNRQIIEHMQIVDKKPNVHMMSTYGNC